MKTIDFYFKKHQRHGMYHFAKRMNYLQPPVSEVINFLNDIPIIEHREYDLCFPGDRIDFDAFFEVWEAVTQEEYKEAFTRATQDQFDFYINGKKQW